jgi:hypothetical protein
MTKRRAGARLNDRKKEQRAKRERERERKRRRKRRKERAETHEEGVCVSPFTLSHHESYSTVEAGEEEEGRRQGRDRGRGRERKCFSLECHSTSARLQVPAGMTDHR